MAKIYLLIAQDFLKLEFNGKVITCYPNDDDVTLYLFYTIVQKYGWEFMDKYMAYNPQWVRGHLGTLVPWPAAKPP